MKQWSKDDLFVVDLIMRTVTVHRQYFAQAAMTVGPGATKEEGGSLTSKASELTVPPSGCRSRSSTPTLPHQHRHKLLRSKDSSSSISSTDSTQGNLRDGSQGAKIDSQNGEGNREMQAEENKKVEERVTAESAENVEEVDGIKSVRAAVAGRGGSVPPSPVPSHQSTTSSCGGGVTLRERRKRGRYLFTDIFISCKEKTEREFYFFFPYSWSPSYY